MSTRFTYRGTGSTYAPIWFKNLILRVITLNFYYPWAKAARLQYQFSNTEIDGSPLEFHGTGKQLFRGYIVTLVALFGAALLAWFLSSALAGEETGVDGPARYFSNFYILLLAPLVPLAIHGTLRYRLANTTWRGIRMGYVGQLSELYVEFLKGIGLTLITFGLGASWYQARIRRYAVAHSKIGQADGHFTGTGGELFMVANIGVLITLFTLGIYTPWFIRNLLRYQFNNLYVQIGELYYPLHTDITALDCFKAFIVLPILQGVTFGLATPWTWTKAQEIVIRSLSIPEDFPFDQLLQVNPEYVSAVGEDLADALDVDFGL